MGYDDAAKQVLFELEGRVRTEERERLLARHPVSGVFDSTTDFLSWATIGYGIHPGWAALESIGLAGLGWIIFRRAYRLGAMVPTVKEARDTFCKGQVPEQYQPFTPLVYSIENCVPLVKFGQDERWQPNMNPSLRRAVPPPQPRGKFARSVDTLIARVVPGSLITPTALRWVRWLMIGLGWLFATFFLAGLSGLVKAY
jgi:hypothetical protein